MISPWKSFLFSVLGTIIIHTCSLCIQFPIDRSETFKGQCQNFFVDVSQSYVGYDADDTVMVSIEIVEPNYKG